MGKVKRVYALTNTASGVAGEAAVTAALLRAGLRVAKGMFMRTAIGVALLSMTLLAGCGDSAGDQFLGKWVGVKNDKHVLEIERNGDSYMVRNTEPSPFTGKTRTTNIPATLQDDVLQVSVGFGAISLAIDGKSGNLTDGRMEYRRQE